MYYETNACNVISFVSQNRPTIYEYDRKIYNEPKKITLNKTPRGSNITKLSSINHFNK